jgi:galactan endo-beta-1,3-galactanase
MLLSLPALVVAFVSAGVRVQAQTTVIPSDSFSSVSRFEQFWNYLYPWGSDHNGSASIPIFHLLMRNSFLHSFFFAGARMFGSSSDHSHISPAGGTLSLIATPLSNPSPPNSSSNPHPAIHYASGAVHAKSQITVTNTQSWTIQGEFSAPTARGTWPAFWLTVSTQGSYMHRCVTSILSSFSFILGRSRLAPRSRHW